MRKDKKLFDNKELREHFLETKELLRKAGILDNN